MTDHYAIFGNPIAHSKSPLIHSLFAEQTHQDMEYKKMLVEHGQFDLEAKKFFAAGGKGLNITVPFKLDAFTFVDKLTPRAKQAGAVNTLKKLDGGEIFGDNTDGIGLVRDLTQNLGWSIKSKHILILGAGGAVRGILGPLFDQQPKSITIANRTVSKAQYLADLFASFQIQAVSYGNLPSQPMDLIINGTSASLDGELPPLNSKLIGAKTCCYDMMYGNKPTIFMEWALQLECRKIADGLGMLIEQAAESFYLWRGIMPATQPVIKCVREGLLSS